MRIHLSAALSLSLSGLAFGQNKQELTARELFGTVAGSKVMSSQAGQSTPKQPAAQVKKAATPLGPIAQTRPAPPRPIREFRQNDGTVQIVTASYEGPKPFGLRYSVLQASDADWIEASDTKVFHSGDKIRVRVESSEDAWFSILQRGSSGKWEALFPSKEGGSDNRILAGEPRTIPGSRSWVFDETKGQERLFVILSRKPFGDIDQLISEISQAGKTEQKKSMDPVRTKPVEPPSAPAPKQTMLAQSIGSIDDALVGRLQSRMLSRDLVFERVDDSVKTASAGKPVPAGPLSEKAAYVVDKSGKPDARVFADIKLQHQ